jgi:itaconate CoA-transferase
MTTNEDVPSGPQGRLPLKGVRVLSLEQAVAAPLCTQHLRDLGAHIIKVERPGSGDFARAYDSSVGGESAWFYWLNRGKSSLALDLKHPRSADILARLLGQVDVFIQNMAPGAASRLGLGSEVLRRQYPALIVCNISGYGPDGPYRDRKAYDAILQGETGVIALTGNDAQPARAGISVADIATGMYALSSVLAALYQRRGDGAGCSIDVSLFDSLSQWVSPALYGFLATGRQPRRSGTRHSNIVPYGVFRAGDGAQVSVAVQNEREWSRFCRVVLQAPELEGDSRFVSNERRVEHRLELEPLIEDALESLDGSELIRRLDLADLPWGEYRDVAGLASHPQLLERGRLLDPEQEGLPPVMAHPMNLEGLGQSAGRVPAVGEHTLAVLSEAGYSPVEIESFLADKTVEAGA